MSVKTVYCVQTFSGQKGRSERGRLRQYANEPDALRAGRGLKEHASGVVIFSVTGEPDFDWWDDPVVIESHGRVPSAY